MKSSSQQFITFIKFDFFAQLTLLALIGISAIVDEYYTLDLIVGFGIIQFCSMLFVYFGVEKGVTAERTFHLKATATILAFYGITYLNSKLHFLDFLGNYLFIIFLFVVLLSIVVAIYYFAITATTYGKSTKRQRSSTMRLRKAS